MKKHLLFVFVGLMLYQTFCGDFGKVSAENAVPDTLSWTWEVSSTTSTQTKTCTLEFSDNLLVNWGDGVTEWIPDSLSSKAITHVYSVQANYTCTAIGVGIFYFKADSKRLLTLDPLKAPSLTYLSCTSNQISFLNLTKNTQLASLYCGGNNLKILNLSQNTKLQTLTCSDNQLAELDVSMLPVLKKITGHTNPLVRINTCPTGALTYLSCFACSLSAESLDSIFVALPTLGTVSASKNLFVLNNPGSSSCHSEIAAAKNWTLDRVITQSSFYLPSVSCKMADSAQVNICLKNTAPVIAFELDLMIPDGFILDTLRSCLSAARKGQHLLSVARISTSAQLYRFIAYSLKMKDVFSGTDGSLLELYFKAPEVVKTYTMDIQNVVLIDTLTNLMAVSVTDGQIMVKSISQTGDANGDKMVDVTDIVNLVAFINGRQPAGLDSAAIDLDGNGLWNVADIAKLVVIINSGEILSRSISVRTSSDVGILSIYRAEEASVGNHLFLRCSAENSENLELCLDNVDDVQAFQVDIILPEGFKLQTGQFLQNSGRNSGQVFSIHQYSENRYRLLSYALKPDAAFLGKSGILANLVLEGTENVSDGSYPITMEHAVLTGMNLSSVSSKLYGAVLILGPQKEKEESITFGTDRNSHLWIRGDGLTAFSVWDFTGKLLIQKQLNEVNFYSEPLGRGLYMVRASSRYKCDYIQKVAVE